MAYGYFWVRVKGKEAFKRAPQKQNEEVEDPWLYVAAPSVFQSQSGTCSTLYIDFRTVTESQENRSHRPYNHTSTTSSFYARWNMSVSTTTFLKTCMLVSYLQHNEQNSLFKATNLIKIQVRPTYILHGLLDRHSLISSQLSTAFTLHV